MNQPLKDILYQNGISELTVVDVGAMESLDFIPELAPITRLYAFEPNPEECKKLEAKYNRDAFKAFHLEQTALGEQTGTAQFHVTKQASMSSLLEPDPVNYEKHFGSYKEFDTWKTHLHHAESFSVGIQTADTYFKNINIDYLKLDTQGSELAILKGAQELLSHQLVQVIKVEVSTIPVYKGQALFSDIDLFLRNHRYILVDFMTYRRDYSPLLNPGHEHAHDAPCGDAIYVLEDDTATTGILIKKGILLHWLGYPGIAGFYFKKAGLTPHGREVLKSIRTIKHKPFYKRLLKSIMPPVLYRLIKPYH